jgi:hypothetical protein
MAGQHRQPGARRGRARLPRRPHRPGAGRRGAAGGVLAGAARHLRRRTRLAGLAPRCGTLDRHGRADRRAQPGVGRERAAVADRAGNRRPGRRRPGRSRAAAGRSGGCAGGPATPGGRSANRSRTQPSWRPRGRGGTRSSSRSATPPNPPSTRPRAPGSPSRRKRRPPRPGPADRRRGLDDIALAGINGDRTVTVFTAADLFVADQAPAEAGQATARQSASAAMPEGQSEAVSSAADDGLGTEPGALFALPAPDPAAGQGPRASSRPPARASGRSRSRRGAAQLAALDGPAQPALFDLPPAPASARRPAARRRPPAPRK